MSYIILNEHEGQVTPQLYQEEMSDLGEGDVLIDVKYSSLNYKDMLAFQPKSKVIASYPLIPGIDLSGIVISSNHPQFQPQQAILATGYELGTKHNGGWSTKAKLPAEWCIPIDDDQLKKAMYYGTAGLTAALSLHYLFESGLDKNASILVTGATGGVGSIALMILQKLGFKKITALIHQHDKMAKLKDCGVTQFIFSDDLDTKRPLQRQNYDYIIDTVGGNTLAGLLPQVAYNGVVTTCGNAAGNTLNTTMFPFILRGIRLIGVNSVYIDSPLRQNLWHRLFNEWDVTSQMIAKEIKLEDIPDEIQTMQEKRHIGRIIVSL